MLQSEERYKEKEKGWGLRWIQKQRFKQRRQIDIETGMNTESEIVTETLLQSAERDNERERERESEREKG